MNLENQHSVIFSKSSKPGLVETFVQLSLTYGKQLTIYLTFRGERQICEDTSVLCQTMCLVPLEEKRGAFNQLPPNGAKDLRIKTNVSTAQITF